MKRLLALILILVGLSQAAFGVAATDATPIPKYNTAYRVTFPIFKNDGTLISGATGMDTQVSLDAGNFAAATVTKPVEIQSTGIYYQDLSAAEMKSSTTAFYVKVTSTGAVIPVVTLYPSKNTTELASADASGRVDVGLILGTAPTEVAGGDLAANISKGFGILTAGWKWTGADINQTGDTYGALTGNAVALVVKSLALGATTITNAGGVGLTILGSTTGASITGTATSGLDLVATKGVGLHVSSADGDGAHVHGGGAAGYGIYVDCTGGLDAVALVGSEVSLSNALSLTGGGAASLFITAGAVNGSGVSVKGNDNGAALLLTGGATGNGLTAKGGSTSGHGIGASATDGDGIQAVGKGTGYDINADIQGALSGAVGSMTDNGASLSKIPTQAANVTQLMGEALTQNAAKDMATNFSAAFGIATAGWKWTGASVNQGADSNVILAKFGFTGTSPYFVKADAQYVGGNANAAAAKGCFPADVATWLSKPVYTNSDGYPQVDVALLKGKAITTLADGYFPATLGNIAGQGGGTMTLTFGTAPIVDLVDAPNAKAVTAIQKGLSTFDYTTNKVIGSLVDKVTTTDSIAATGLDLILKTATFSQALAAANWEYSTAAIVGAGLAGTQLNAAATGGSLTKEAIGTYLDASSNLKFLTAAPATATALTTLQGTATKLETMLEANGLTYSFTTGAMKNVAVEGVGDWTAAERKQMRQALGITGDAANTTGTGIVDKLLKLIQGGR